MRSDERMHALELGPEEVEQRRSFYEIGDDDLETMRGMREWADAHHTELIERFYDHLLAHPETASFFRDPALLRRVKQAQQRHLEELFSGVCDVEFTTSRLRVGDIHEQVGVEPKWYIGAYSRYCRTLIEKMGDEFGFTAETLARFQSVLKMMFYDMAVALDAYNAANEARLARHQAAIRELSTPVIKVHDGVLLLPIVGTIDSLRAQQIMEAVLGRVAAEQARVCILDIAGVAVVDTEVAGHLMKTTAAVRLLGSDTIVTGISAQVAKTIVELGVDISGLHTRSTLDKGIPLALELVGKRIARCDEGAE